MSRPTVLIGGGYDKQSEYDDWIESFDGKVKWLVLIGQTTPISENGNRRIWRDPIAAVVLLCIHTFVHSYICTFIHLCIYILSILLP